MLAAPEINVDMKTLDSLADLVGLQRRSTRARKMGDAVLEVLQDCVGKDHALRRAPRRSARLDRLKTLLRARHAFAKAIKGLDDWTWIELSDDFLDTAICDLPPAFWSAGTRQRPLVPIALTEFGRAARALRTHLRKTEEARTMADVYRDEAIVRLADLFNTHAPARQDGDRAKKGVIAFVVCALESTRPSSNRKPLLVAPEDRKVWQRIVRHAKKAGTRRRAKA